MRVLPGQSYPLGATWDGLGVNFALFSENATKVELCLFDSPYSTQESERIELPEYSNHVWHGYLPHVLPGQVYGYRVYGPYDPAKGLRFNPNKVLVDPYARAIVRTGKWDDTLYGYEISGDADDLTYSPLDSAGSAPLCAVVDPAFSWGSDTPPRTPWHKTVIYEAHVKGLTILNQEIRPDLRGTYAALASDSIIKHLKALGVTAVELMPVHYRIDDSFLNARGLTNYWGYNSICFFSPDPRYSWLRGPTDHVREFKMMVRALHAAGLEVILDVVYNHTGEGSQLGPTLSFRGIDNTAYYRTDPKKPQEYIDYTGCGNTLNVAHPRVLQLIMDSLRYWIQDMHVDGFRFDLASALARELFDVDKLSSFFDIIQQDPVISQVKLIAEPWDLGEGGYQVGNFPVLWTEWNGKFRDSVRRFWRGDAGLAGEMATRLAGSSDLYEHSGRSPHASINFVTCHDGFTLQDLVTYNEKHNEANLESNRDGESHNHSFNFGVEGPTKDREIIDERYRQKRNFMTSVILSLGVPMISGGDEMGRTQRGNNNAYCQDNPLSWYNWELTADEEDFLDFVRKLSAIRRSQPVLQRRKFLVGQVMDEMGNKDVMWLNVKGEELEQKEWLDQTLQCFGLLLDGNCINEVDEFGDRIVGNTILIILNTSTEDKPFLLPIHHTLPHRKITGKPVKECYWNLLVDTYRNTVSNSCWSFNDKFDLKARSMAVFELVDAD
jgi:isoamylase